MARTFPGCPFERYADDVIVHCKTRRQAEEVLGRIVARMAQVGLRVHPDKTRIVYCQDGKRRGDHEHTSFTYLGYTFRARKARAKNGSYFCSFLPAMSAEALKAKSDRLRRMRIHRRTDLTLDGLAEWLNPITAGWLLRPVLPVRDGAPPAARQHLPEALGPEEVQAAADLQAVPTVVDRAAPTSPWPIRPLAGSPQLLND